LLDSDTEQPSIAKRKSSPGCSLRSKTTPNTSLKVSNTSVDSNVRNLEILHDPESAKKRLCYSSPMSNNQKELSSSISEVLAEKLSTSNSNRAVTEIPADSEIVSIEANKGKDFSGVIITPSPQLLSTISKPSTKSNPSVLSSSKSLPTPNAPTQNVLTSSCKKMNVSPIRFLKPTETLSMPAEEEKLARTVLTTNVKAKSLSKSVGSEPTPSQSYNLLPGTASTTCETTLTLPQVQAVPIDSTPGNSTPSLKSCSLNLESKGNLKNSSIGENRKEGDLTLQSDSGAIEPRTEISDETTPQVRKPLNALVSKKSSMVDPVDHSLNWKNQVFTYNKALKLIPTETSEPRSCTDPQLTSITPNDETRNANEDTSAIVKSDNHHCDSSTNVLPKRIVTIIPHALNSEKTGGGFAVTKSLNIINRKLNHLSSQNSLSSLANKRCERSAAEKTKSAASNVNSVDRDVNS